MRLNKFIATTGYCSRRKADELIFNGQVRVNNEIILVPSYDVKDNDVVKVNDKILRVYNYRYYIFYKPTNVLTSYDDSRGRRCLKDFDFFQKNNLAYSGRLDYKSEGLILFTNNGELIYRLQTPKFKVEKEYVVEVNKNLTEKERLILENGLKTEEYNYGKCKITEIGKGNYQVILTEGKNRQIRNMFSYFGIKVINLKRVRIGELKLNGLKPGEIKEIPEYIIKEYFNV
ncbi:rRNA pseudouridine synthase [Deferribacteraceae bacterium V6Fe1]|nr:rRNA pseudouridine synthase [Deferribacteraceae bacterium V6Fe1]